MTTQNTFHIVPAIWKHYAVLAELGASTFYETFSEFHSAEDMDQYLTKTYALKQMELNTKTPGIHYFLAYGNGNELGYIKLIENIQMPELVGSTIELEKIYIRKEALGSGLGEVLMNTAIQKATQLGFQNLYLGVWQENLRALAFYKKCGFAIFGKRNFKLGETICDDFLLVKQLSTN